MTKVKGIFKLAFVDFRKWLRNPRVYVVFIGLLLFVHTLNKEIRIFCAETGYRAAPYLITFLLHDSYFVFVFLFFATLLFCNAPFIDNLTPYDMIRSGRKLWFVSKLIYIILAAFIFILLLFLITLIVLFPYVTFLGDWGHVFRTLALTGQGNTLGLPQISANIVQLAKPLPLTFFTLTNFFLQCVIVGLIMFCMGLLTKTRGLGIALASVYSFLPGMQMFWQLNIFRDIFPPLWVSQMNLRPFNFSSKLNQQEALLVLLGMIVLLSVVSWFALAKRDIELYPEI